MQTPDYSERYNEKLQKKYLWNITVIKQYIITVLDVDEKLLGTILRRCSDHHYGRTKKITGVEKKVYDYLVGLKVSLKSVYTWYLASRLPEDIKSDLISGKIDQKKAIRLGKNKEFGKALDATWRMMELIRKTVREVV